MPMKMSIQSRVCPKDGRLDSRLLGNDGGTFFPKNALILMIFKGISQVARRRAKGGIDGKSSDGNEDYRNRNTKNCCWFHKIVQILSALSYRILQKLTPMVSVEPEDDRHSSQAT